MSVCVCVCLLTCTPSVCCHHHLFVLSWRRKKYSQLIEFQIWMANFSSHDHHGYYVILGGQMSGLWKPGQTRPGFEIFVWLPCQIGYQKTIKQDSTTIVADSMVACCITATLPHACQLNPWKFVAAFEVSFQTKFIDYTIKKCKYKTVDPLDGMSKTKHVIQETVIIRRLVWIGWICLFFIDHFDFISFLHGIRAVNENGKDNNWLNVHKFINKLCSYT